MKPAPFDYVRATTVEGAVEAVSGGGARFLAGGQSLVPMLNFRLVEAERFVDINRIPGLDGIAEDGGGVRVGALTRHSRTEASGLVRERFPVLHAAMGHVAHLAVRNRGTFAGSLCHADPAAELPALSLLLEATIETASPSGGRSLAARDFFVGPLQSALAGDEMVTAVTIPALPAGCGWGFEEVARRRGDFAVAGAAAVVAVDGGSVSTARVAVLGVHGTPLRAGGAEALLVGRPPDRDAVAAAAAAARDEAEPMDDFHGSADYRRHLTEVLVRRAVSAAAGRARGAAP